MLSDQNPDLSSGTGYIAIYIEVLHQDKNQTKPMTQNRKGNNLQFQECEFQIVAD